MKSLSNLTVDEYQLLYSIHKSDGDDVDKSIQLVSILTGKTRAEVEDMPLDEFRNKSREISVIFSGPAETAKPKQKIKIYGKTYRVCLNPRKITAGQYIDLQHFLKGNMIENLHKIMACLVVPYKFWGTGKYDGANHELIAEGILDCKFSDIHGTCVFFLMLWSASIKAIAPFLSVKIREKMGTNLLSPADLQNVMDGSIMLNR